MAYLKYTGTNNPFRVLIADDDVDDVQLTKDCFDENNLPIHVKDVGDGQVLMDHLKLMIDQRMADNLPQLILLDLNMPRKSGFEALKEIKGNDTLSKIPVVIFSTSKAPKDIEQAYQLGASCFVSKPNTLEEWCDKMGKLGRFWIDCVKVAN
jgi:two-component system, chemotaxis family, response regulator Rcp1